MEVTFICYAHGSQVVLFRWFWGKKFHFDDVMWREMLFWFCSVRIP